MNFLAKLIHFLKNFHPIRSFAKPIQRTEEKSEPVVISYEAFTRELAEPVQAVRYESSIPSYTVEETYTQLTAQASSEYEESEERQTIMLVPKVEISRELDFVLEPADVLEEPIARDTTIGELVAGTHAEDIVGEAVVEETRIEEVQKSEEPLAVIVAEVPVEQVAEQEPVQEVKKRTRKSAAPKAKKTPAKKTVRKTVAQTTKKTTKAKKATPTRTRRKNSVPPEAMGFGF
jgi:hypothetical protein